MQEKSSYFISLKIIHLALLAGQCIFLAVVVYMVVQESIPKITPRMDKILQVASLVLSFAAVIGATVLFKRKLTAISKVSVSLAEKSEQYRMVSIVKWALLEGASLFSTTCFLLTGNYSFAALSMSIIVFFGFLAPSRIKAMIQLRLNERELDALK